MPYTVDTLRRLKETNALREELADALERHAELLMRLNHELDRYYLHVEVATRASAGIVAPLGALLP